MLDTVQSTVAPGPSASLFALLFAALFGWVALALGRRIQRLLGPLPAGSSVWEKGLISISLGGGFIQLLPYGLSLFGHMTATTVRVSFFALAALLIPDLFYTARALRRELARVSLKQLPAAAFVWAALFAAWLGMRLCRAMVIGNLGDDDGYHLSAPMRWLEAGTLSYLPSYTNTNAAMGFELLFAIALSVCNPVGAKLLHFGAGLLALFGVVLCGRRLGSTLGGIAAVSLVLIATPFTYLSYQFGQAYVDFGPCWMAVASSLIWLIWREDPNRTLLLCWALCAGFAGAFKITGLSVALVWMPILIWELYRRATDWRRIAATVVGFGALSFAPVVPWLARNWRITGNPVFPMLSSLIPTRDWSTEHAQIFSKYMRYYSWAVAAGARLSEGQRKHLLLAAEVAIIVLGSVAIWLVRRPPLRALLICATGFVLISLGTTGVIFRYWLPAMLWASVVIGFLLVNRFSERHRWWPALGLMSLAVASVARDLGSDGHSLVKDARIALGLTTAEQAYPDDALLEMWSYVRQQTPHDAHFLVAAFYRTFGASSFGGFPIDRVCYVTDSHLQNFIRLEDWQSFLSSVREAGIRYVVISDTLFGASRLGFEFPAARNEYPFSRRLVDEYGAKIAQFDHLQLYAVANF